LAVLLSAGGAGVVTVAAISSISTWGVAAISSISTWGVAAISSGWVGAVVGTSCVFRLRIAGLFLSNFLVGRNLRLRLLGERCIPLKVGRIRGVLSESEPAMPRVGSLLVFIFVCEELDVFVFVSFGVLYPVSLVLWIAVPVGEF